MTRREIDTYFTENHDLLLRIATGLCVKKKRTYPPELAITEAYLECIRNKKITDVDTLQRFAISRMSLEINASKSTLNRRSKFDECQELDFRIGTSDPDHDTDLINEYMSSCKDTLKRIVLDAYLNKGHSSQRKLADYFGLSPTTIHFTMNEIKEDIREFHRKNIHLH